MKKFLLMIAIGLLLTMSQMDVVTAAKSDGYIHNNQYYAVSFDGEGDAIVRAQIDIENTIDRAIKRIDLEIPGQIVVYKAMQESPTRERIEYEKTVTSDVTLLHLELGTAIEQRSQGTIVLFYKIQRYAEKNITGNFDFDFKTIIDKDAILIENVRVAINVQEGLFIKGGEAKVDYRPNIGFMSEAMMVKTADMGINSQEYRDYYYSIRNASGLVKNAQNLDPFESFHVKGNYGENWIALYFFDIAFWILIIATAITGIILILKKIIPKIKEKNNKKSEEKTNKIIKSIVTAFVSSGSAITSAIGSFMIATVINEMHYSMELFALFALMLGLIIAAGFIFIPPIYVFSKDGALYGALTFFLTLLFLVIGSMLIAVVFSVLFITPVYTTGMMID